MRSKRAWMDGRLVPTAEATVPFLNTGLHYGLAVFEGIRAYRTARGSAVFRLPEHIERLMHSAQVLAMPPIPWSQAEIVDRLQRNFELDNWQVYRTEGPVNLSRLFNFYEQADRPDLKYRAFSARELTTRERRARQRVVVHPPSSQRDDDQGQDRGELRQQRPRQDRVRSARVRRGHYARPLRLRGRVHGREPVPGPRRDDRHDTHRDHPGRHHARQPADPGPRPRPGGPRAAGEPRPALPGRRGLRLRHRRRGGGRAGDRRPPDRRGPDGAGHDAVRPERRSRQARSRGRP